VRIGRSSGQSFREAGILRLELTVGVPLQVPLAGPVIGRLARWAAGCPGGQSCEFYSGVDHRGVTYSRVPLRVMADARMQSDARMTSKTPSRSDAGPAVIQGSTSTAAPGGSGLEEERSRASASVQASSTPRLADSDWLPPEQARQPGFLRIGAEREVWAPGSCGISPS
jgi:hypothetical protein